MFRQLFSNNTDGILVWTQNGGRLVQPYALNVRVLQNGQELIPELGQYTIAPDTAPGQSTVTIDSDTHFAGANYVVLLAYAGYSVAISDCMANIVGLDRDACECYEDGAPTDWNTSTSGYYLTDPEYGVPMRGGIAAARDCGSDFWDVLARARDLAVLDFAVDFKAAVNMERDPINQWNGVMGEAKANRMQSVVKPYSGWVVKPVQRTLHQYIVITALYIGMEDSGNVVVRLNSNAFGFSEVTQTVTAQGGRFVKHTLSEPWVLPLYSQEIPDLYYTISFANGGGRVMANRLHCGCGRLPAWMRSLQVMGFTGDEATRDFSDAISRGTDGYGLALEAHLYCDEMAFVCSLDRVAGKNMVSLIGRIIQYKASVKVLSTLLESGKVNQYTLLDRETGFAKMAHYQERYNELVTWLAANLPTGVSGCFGCPTDSINVTPIRV